MNDLYHNPLFEHIREYFKENTSDTIFLYVPYIKTKILKKVLDGLSNNVVIITTWNPQDIKLGSSELELYPFCKENNITLYISQNMHLKVYSVGLASAIVATGNISYRGLMPDGNYEVATLIKTLTSADRLFFENIRNEAYLVTDKMYNDYATWDNDSKIDYEKPPKLSDILSLSRVDDFLISALPMTRSVDDLITGYQRIRSGNEPSDDVEINACVFHDLANYDIEEGLTDEQFIKKLSLQFFAHPFILKIDEFIAPDAYFGRIKEWIQDNCTDVPIPSRRELTGNVQVLLEWFEKLGDGKYKIDIPGKHSQRIVRNHK